MPATRRSLALVPALLAASALVGGSPAATAAEPPPLVTDRPDVTESAETVRRGAVQVEIGYGHARVDGDGGVELDRTSFPATLVRVGLGDRVELRVGWDGYVAESLDAGGVETEQTGVADLALGAKVKLREGLALLVGAGVPSGSRAFRAERVDPAVVLAASHALTDALSLGYNVGYGAETVQDAPGDLDTRGLGRYSASLAIGLTDRWGAFVEAFGFLPADGGPAHSADAGVTFLASKNVQLDLSGGAGLNERADDWFVGAGISFRVPR